MTDSTNFVLPHIYIYIYSGSSLETASEFKLRKTGEKLELTKHDHVLEIGTGSGYQTAILAQLVEKVYTVERIQGLHDRAKEHLKLLSVRNVQFKYDDGNIGWGDRGPFDGIIVTASPRHIPESLLSQLAQGGRLIIPVGDTKQELKLVTKNTTGYETKILEDVNFVPLLGGKS